MGAVQDGEGVITPIEEMMPHIASEVICVKCGRRWIAVRPVQVWLKDMECENCGAGYVIETGQELGEDEV